MWPEPYRELRAVYGEAQGLSGEIRYALGLRSERALALAAEEAVLSGRYRVLLPHDDAGIADLVVDCKARIARLQADPDGRHHGIYVPLIFDHARLPRRLTVDRTARARQWLGLRGKGMGAHRLPQNGLGG